MTSTTIILCTVNEYQTLPHLVSEIDKIAGFEHQFIFVDDGSTDGTREFIVSYVKEHRGSKYIFNHKRKSLLIANMQGIGAADGDYVIIMDADGQHPPSIINEIYGKLKGGYDVVIASRYAAGGSTGNRHAHRALISRVAHLLAIISLKSARRTTDPMSGYFGFRRSLKFFANERWFGYKTLLYLLSSNPNARVLDVPYVFRERASGESKIVTNVGFIITYIRELIHIKAVEMRVKNFISDA